MTNFQLKKATKTQSKLRMAIFGPSGSGKTYSSLAIAKGLGGKIAVIDTERGSASKYADKFDFDVIELDTFGPQTYAEAIKFIEAQGYDIIIVDSLSHAWSGKDGALEQVDKAAKRNGSGNTYTAWRDVTPNHNAMIDAIVGSRCHVIATMRSKTEYVMEANERGKMAPRKVGLAPIQRDGMEYEFDVVGEMDIDNVLVISKSRCEALTAGVFTKPNGKVSDMLKAWLSDGAPAGVVTDADVNTTSALFTNYTGKLKSITPDEWKAGGQVLWEDSVATTNTQAKLRGIQQMSPVIASYGKASDAIKKLGEKIQECVDYDIAQKAQQLGGVLQPA